MYHTSHLPHWKRSSKKVLRSLTFIRMASDERLCQVHETYSENVLFVRLADFRPPSIVSKYQASTQSMASLNKVHGRRNNRTSQCRRGCYMPWALHFHLIAAWQLTQTTKRSLRTSTVQFNTTYGVKQSTVKTTRCGTWTFERRHPNMNDLPFFYTFWLNPLDHTGHSYFEKARRVNREYFQHAEKKLTQRTFMLRSLLTIPSKSSSLSQLLTTSLWMCVWAPPIYTAYCNIYCDVYMEQSTDSSG